MGVSTFFIKQIKSEHDIQTLEQYLSNVQGIERVLMDTEDNELKIEYDEKEVNLIHIVEKIEGKGFQIQ